MICALMHHSKIQDELLYSFGALRFAAGDLEVGDVQPGILIGLDQYHRFVKPSIVSSVPGGLFAQDSVLDGLCWDLSFLLLQDLQDVQYLINVCVLSIS